MMATIMMTMIPMINPTIIRAVNGMTPMSETFADTLHEHVIKTETMHTRMNIISVSSGMSIERSKSKATCIEMAVLQDSY